MTTTITVTINDVSGEPMMDTQCMALLFGVDESACTALPTVDGHARIPREWARRGKLRALEAKAHTNSDNLLDTLAYWANHDHGRHPRHQIPGARITNPISAMVD